MRLSKLILLLAPLLLAGCVAGYTLVEPGAQTLGAMQVTAGNSWNKAPAGFSPSSRPDAQTWTIDGLMLDRLMIIPAVADGESIFNSRNKSAALPTFKLDMLPNEIEELVESSFVKLFGEGNAVVSTSGLRPQGFGATDGFMFDVQAAVTESPDYRGIVGAFVDQDRLYLVAYLAAEPHYYEKNRAMAEAVIRSAGLSRSATDQPQ